MSSRATSLNGRSSDAGRPTSSTRHPTPPPAPASFSSPAHIEQLRQHLSTGLQSQPELRDLLGLCAESNQWSVEEARQRPDTVVHMELFLLQVHRVPLVRYFPNLVTIKFMSIGLESTSDFSALTHVEELWLSDNNLRCIEGLENMTKLRRLFLQGNSITSLEGLPPLRHLRELWVSRNQLQRLTHLTPLRKLRALYAADNPIGLLDGAFSKDMTHLHDVNLSGCHLADIAQLCYLQQLPCLRNVWFSDPLFGENPICRMNNYTTLVLAMLDALECLDGAYVPAEQRSLVESVLGKKKSYYAMRAQMLETHLVFLTRHAEACAAQDAAQNADALSQLHACLQPIEAELLERQLYSSGSEAEENGRAGSLFTGVDEQRQVPESAKLEVARLQLSRAIGTCELYEQRTLLRLAEAVNATAVQAQLLKERLAVELHTAGNVRLEAVSPQHEYFASIDALLQERFQRDVFERELGITSVAVKGVRRIINRGLRMRFDTRVKELHVNLANPQHRSRFVGLFGVVPATREGQSACLQHALMHGVDAEEPSGTSASADAAGAEYAPTAAEEGVPLTDSLFYADETRLRALGGGCSGGSFTTGGGTAARDSVSRSSQSQSQVYSESRNGDGVVCHGQLVLYRTYLGKAVSALGGAPKRDGAPSSFLAKAGRVLRRDYGEGITTAYRLLPADSSSSSPNGCGGGGDAQAAAASRPRPSYVWYCFDRALVVADCVVDYVYTVSASPVASSPPPSPSALGTVGCGSGTVPLPPDPSAVAVLISSVCPPCGVSGGGKERGGEGGGSAAATDAGRDVREDLSSCAAPLLEFIDWCGGMSPPASTTAAPTASSAHDKHKKRSADTVQGNTLKVVAAKEAAEAVASATAVLGEAVAASLIRPSFASSAATSRATSGGGPGGSDTGNSAQHPLLAHDVEAYASRMHVGAGGLTLCVLRGLGFTAVWKDLTCALLATVTSLDLSLNSLVEFAWFALAKEAPLLQRLNLRGNRLTAIALDGSRLPELRVLDLSGNLLHSVHDFRTIRSAAPALEELELRGNPLLTIEHRQETEAQLWCYLAPPESASGAITVRLNQRTLGGYPSTLAAQRYRRACVFPGGTRASAQTVRVVEHVLRRVGETSSAAGAAAAAALLSVDGVSVPERCVGAVVAEVERWAALDTVAEGLAAASRGRQAPNTANAAHVGGDASTASCLSEYQDFSWSYALLDNMAWLTALLPNLRRVVLRGHALTSLDSLLQLSRLESLDVAENHLTTLPCMTSLKALRELVVDFNRLAVLPKEVGPLPTLRLLSASGNHVTHVDASLFGATAGSVCGSGTPATVPQLETLHLTRNAIADMNVIYALRDIASLLILSVMGNPCTTPDGARVQRPETEAKAAATAPAPEDARQYLIHVFPQLKVLDGCAISSAEGARAREVYAGKINTDLLIEKARGPPDTWAEVRSLNLSHCTLTEVTMLEPFATLEVLQLQHNIISSVSGLTALTRLKALDLSHNRIGTAAWRSVNHVSTVLTTSSLAAAGGAAAASGGATGASSSNAVAASNAYVALGDALVPLKQLESLSIEANQITDLSVLKLRLPRLKFLNARGNELQFLQRGLEHLPDLRELLLDQNKLRGLSAECLAANKKLNILSAENNTLKSLEGLRGCSRLEQLRLGANRLGELKAALYELQACPLKSLVLVGNPVARKSNYRNTVITYFTQLTELDRRPIAAEEREKAAVARVTEYVAPPNVVIDMDFLGGFSGAAAPGAMLPIGGGGLNGNAVVGVVGGGLGAGLPSRNRIANASAAIPAALRRGVGGGNCSNSGPPGAVGGIGGIGASGNVGGAPGSDRFNVNPRSRPYRR